MSFSYNTLPINCGPENSLGMIASGATQVTYCAEQPKPPVKDEIFTVPHIFTGIAALAVLTIAGRAFKGNKEPHNKLEYQKATIMHLASSELSKDELAASLLAEEAEELRSKSNS